MYGWQESNEVSSHIGEEKYPFAIFLFNIKVQRHTQQQQQQQKIEYLSRI